MQPNVEEKEQLTSASARHKSKWGSYGWRVVKQQRNTMWQAYRKRSSQGVENLGWWWRKQTGSW